MVGVRFDAVEEIIVGGVEQISDGRQIVIAISESLAAAAVTYGRYFPFLLDCDIFLVVWRSWAGAAGHTASKSTVTP